MKKKVVIDPGHGGKFSGFVLPIRHKGGEPDELCEKYINLIAASEIAARLRLAGVDVFLTRDADVPTDSNLDKDLSNRAKFAGFVRADCFVSIHCNGFKDKSANGFEVFTTPGQDDSDDLAEQIFMEVKKTKLLAMRMDEEDGDYDREANFKVIDEAPCPGCLVELGFMTNSYDLSVINGAKRVELCEAIVKGILRWVMP